MWLLMLILIVLPGLAQAQIHGVGARPDENDASAPRQGVTFGSDGSSYIHTPGATFGSNGETYIHTPGATFASDGESYIHTPGATFGSDGTTYIHTPTATFTSDGNTFISTPGATFASDGSSYIHVPSAAAVGATRMPFLYDRAAREDDRAATDWNLSTTDRAEGHGSPLRFGTTYGQEDADSDYVSDAPDTFISPKAIFGLQDDSTRWRPGSDLSQ